MYAFKKCRLCLKLCKSYLNLFKGNYRQIIQELTSLRISETDGYPQIACIGCIYEIQQASKTRKRILECHKKLVSSNLIKESVKDLQEIQNDYPDTANLDYQDSAMETYCNNVPSRFLAKRSRNISSKENDDSTYMPKIKLHSYFIKKEVENIEPQNQVFEECTIKHELETNMQKISADFVKSFQENFSNSYPRVISEQKRDGCEVDSDKMNNLLNSHTSNISRVCSLCDMQFDDNPKLLIHMHASHKLSLFQCEMCPYIFFRKSKFEEHKMNDHQDFWEQVETLPSKNKTIKYNYPCKFPSCDSRPFKDGKKNKKFFRFPKNPGRAELWKKICNISPETRTTNFYVCKDHFYLSDYNNPNDPTRLNWDAFPKPSVAKRISEEHCYINSIPCSLDTSDIFSI